MNPSPKECINCHEVSNGLFCSSCGQKLMIQRVTARGVMSEFLSKWLGLDNQFGRTVKDLTINPSRVIHGYLKGNRIRYIGPLGFIVIMTALMALSFKLLGIDVAFYLEQIAKASYSSMGYEGLAEKQEATTNIAESMADYFRFISVAIIPFWALTFQWFYKKERLNYIERFVVISYISTQSILFTILALVGYRLINGYFFTTEVMIAGLLYATYVLHKTFPRKNYFFSFTRTFFSQLIAFALAMVSSGIISIVIAALTKE